MAAIREPTGPANPPPWRILFVDDDPLIGMLAGVALRRLGHEVTFAANPGDAFEALEGAPAPFHLVVCDLRLGSGSGFDVAREVLARRPSQRVVLVSGHVSEADRARARELGVAEILSKQAVMTDLDAVLGRILG